MEKDSEAALNQDEKPLILLVEDQPVIQKLVSVLIEKIGYPYIIANDGIDALDMAAEHNPSLIFMDLQMPRMDGYEATQKLRERGFWNPIIAMTASSLIEEHEKCFTFGMEDVLQKPAKRQDIEAKLEKWLTKSAERSSLLTKVESRHKPALQNVEDHPSKVFDEGEALAAFIGNRFLVKCLLVRFIKNTEERLETFPGLIQNQEWETAWREAHAIKSNSLPLTAREIGLLASQLELAFKEANIDKINSILPEMTEALTRLKQAVSNFAIDAGG